MGLLFSFFRYLLLDSRLIIMEGREQGNKGEETIEKKKKEKERIDGDLTQQELPRIGIASLLLVFSCSYSLHDVKYVVGQCIDVHVDHFSPTSLCHVSALVTSAECITISLGFCITQFFLVLSSLVVCGGGDGRRRVVYEIAQLPPPPGRPCA